MSQVRAAFEQVFERSTWIAQKHLSEPLVRHQPSNHYFYEPLCHSSFRVFRGLLFRVFRGCNPRLQP